MTPELDAFAAVPGTANRHAALAGAWLAPVGSENTRRAYRRDLADYIAWLDLHWSDLLTAKRPVVPRKLAAPSSFYRYAASADVIPSNPVEHVAPASADALSIFSTVTGRTWGRQRRSGPCSG